MARTAVIAGTATAVSGGVRNRQAQGFAEQQAAAAQQQAAAAQQQAMTDQAAAPLRAHPAAAAPPAPAMSIDDKIAKIKELGQLKDGGLLTEDEFAAEKAKLLSL
ncbi:SHOCT domain-containing protein [Janibacter sp. GS2]|uniref:SHOCT domain-containing protein n=1 Tax=Janibacter sp. GS2 TaxID=3442646 RepID=UPI003EC0F2FE